MARTVKETPVLQGKDAKQFEENIKKNEHRRVSPEEYKKAIANYRRFNIVTAS